MEKPFTTQDPSSVSRFFFEVTSFSKILTAVVFIALPFIGFVLGLSANIHKGAPFTPHQRIAVDEQLDTYASNFTGITTEVAFIEESDLSTYLNADSRDREKYYKHLTSTQISQEVKPMLSTGYLLVRRVTTDAYDILSAILLESEGGLQGLFKYEKSTGHIVKMQTSNLNHPGDLLSIFSPDKSKLVWANGRTLGYVDLAKDTNVTLHTLATNGTERFNGGCELYCKGELRWLNDSQISVRIYEFDSCDSDQSCQPYYAERWRDATFPLSSL